MEELKIAVLISGKGSNLQAIAKECSKKNVPARIISIISNNPNASGLQIKGKFKKKVINDKLYDKKGFEFRLQNYLAKLKPDLICLAGFMKILSSLIIKKWKNKIINVHPSLLPSFKGLKTHERVISEGVKKSGCTIHFVNETLDGGPIIAQGSTMVKKNMTVKELQKKILKIEHIIYPEVIKLFAKKKITIKNNKVFIKTNKNINKSFD